MLPGLQVAKALGAEPDEIYFTSGGSESDNWAIKGIAFANRKKGNHIITSKIEHHAVLHTCEYLEKEGFTVTYLPVDQYGLVTRPNWRRRSPTRPSSSPSCTPTTRSAPSNRSQSSGAIARKHKIPFHTDAVQAIGNIPIDVKAQNIDLLSLSAHKFYGPKGVGVLYIRKGIKIDNLIHGGGQERRRRAGTENIAGIVGLGKAIELATADIEGITRKIRRCGTGSAGDPWKIPHSHLNGHPEKRLPGNINISFRVHRGRVHAPLAGRRGDLRLDRQCLHLGVARTVPCPARNRPAGGDLPWLPPADARQREHGCRMWTSCSKCCPKVVSRLREMSPLYQGAERKEVAMYSDKVMDHFKNPRNVGEIENANGVGEVGNPVCGDIMNIYLKIENNIITDAKFKTFGCGAAIASSSMATELVKGKTLEEAWEVSNKAVAEALEGLPPIKMHCSVLAEEGIHKAINDYRKKQGLEPWVEKNPHSHEHEEGTCQH